ncbi:methyl-CpG-binding domain-containing protein 5-like [Bidens hawaiensis]|uniref:methyl-CpG-binding domain-containing protein 5-like n=1 Tax=Bidens hawaiensis TaxID=980011 RepID=UPI00404B8AFD
MSTTPISGDQPPAPIVNPSEPEDPPATPDPLLGSGSFIDPNNGTTADPKEPEAAKTDADPDPLLQKYGRPAWLPDDWDMILKKRTSGATLGTVDRYYISPSGHRLRSKNEVVTFLETGSKRKKPSTPSSDDASAKSAKTAKSASKDSTATKKKTSARKKVHAAFTFDFKNPPEKVSWCLSYATDDVWSPNIGDWSIPLATKQEWASVFDHVCKS